MEYDERAKSIIGIAVYNILLLLIISIVCAVLLLSNGHRRSYVLYSDREALELFRTRVGIELDESNFVFKLHLRGGAQELIFGKISSSYGIRFRNYIDELVLNDNRWMNVEIRADEIEDFCLGLQPKLAESRFNSFDLVFDMYGGYAYNRVFFDPESTTFFFYDTRSNAIAMYTGWFTDNPVPNKERE